jgi:putative FmdB family regulatory protein
MPIYEYRCASCGFQNEYLQRVRDPLLTDCPTCGKPTFKKLVTAAGFQLKGSGWYATDFKNSGAKPKADKGADKDKAADKPVDKGADKASDKAADKPADTKKDASKSEASSTGASPV